MVLLRSGVLLYPLAGGLQFWAVFGLLLFRSPENSETHSLLTTDYSPLQLSYHRPCL